MKVIHFSGGVIFMNGKAIWLYIVFIFIPVVNLYAWTAIESAREKNTQIYARIVFSRLCSVFCIFFSSITPYLYVYVYYYYVLLFLISSPGSPLEFVCIFFFLLTFSGFLGSLLFDFISFRFVYCFRFSLPIFIRFRFVWHAVHARQPLIYIFVSSQFFPFHFHVCWFFLFFFFFCFFLLYFKIKCTPITECIFQHREPITNIIIIRSRTTKYS